MRFTINKNAIAFIILLGSFISALGSSTFVMMQYEKFKELGLSLVLIGIYAGITRGASVVSSLIGGYFLDRFDEKKVLLVTEFSAAFISLSLLIFWTEIKSLFIFYTFLVGLRTIFITAQFPSRSKMLKIFGQVDNRDDHRFAIWLNLVTHGPILFAGLLSYIILNHIDFRWVILFDMTTFILSGIFVLFVPKLDQKYSHINKSIFDSVKHFYSHNRIWAIADLFLAMTFAGMNMMAIRIAGPDYKNIPLYFFVYGLSVWLSGFIPTYTYKRKIAIFAWLLFFINFVALGSVVYNPHLNLILFFFLCLGYWIIFQIISSKIQILTPINLMAGVQSARNFQMLSILTIGEVFIGCVDTYFSITNEMFLRAIISLPILLTIIKWRESEYDTQTSNN